MRPAAWFDKPTWISPLRKVPAVRTTARRRKAHAELGHHTGDAVAVQDQVVTGLRENRQVGLVFQAAANRLPIQYTIGLRARRAHRRSLARIENPELDARFIDGLGHGAAQCIDLLDQMPLANAADRWVAAHRT
jgi:hypothetical protein